MKYFFVITILVFSVFGFQPSRIFGSNMVLQRDQPISIWGESTATSVFVSLGPSSQTVSVVNGKFEFQLPPLPLGSPSLTLVIREVQGGSQTVTYSNIMMGDVFVCSGQSNMQWPVLGALNPQPDIEDSDKYTDLRFFTIPPRSEPAPVDDVLGSGWHVSHRSVTGMMSAVCFFYGRELHKRLRIPIGLIATSVGGTAIERWMSTDALAKCPGEKNDAFAHLHYNAMIHPILKFKHHGALWYQGESNSGNPKRYACLLPAMIEDWRAKWKNDFYFLNVELAGFENLDFRELRWVQQKVTLKKYGLASSNDLGEMADIHPRRKKEVGERLALIAFRHIYNVTSVESSGPVVDRVIPTREGQTIRLVIQFAGQHHIGGFETRPTAFCTTCCNQATHASMFQLVVTTGSGATHTVDTQFQLTDTEIILTAQIGSDQTHVGTQYAWHKFPQCMMYSKRTHLPMQSFRITPQ